MNDTQWPTFAVFHQTKAGNPHLHAGSVHAPDPELALMNARDVFVRRPPCVSLWVVPSGAIFSWTREQLADPEWAASGQINSSQPELFQVWKKSQPAGACAFLAEVEAFSPADALKQILDTRAAAEGLLWWVIPAREITKSSHEDIESMFAPAVDKPYRHQSDFNTLTQMRELAARQSRQSSDEP